MRARRKMTPEERLERQYAQTAARLMKEEEQHALKRKRTRDYGESALKSYKLIKQEYHRDQQFRAVCAESQEVNEINQLVESLLYPSRQLPPPQQPGEPQIDILNNPRIEVLDNDDHDDVPMDVDGALPIVNCVICQTSLNEGENSTLACSHMFHTVCLNDWITSRNDAGCPLCRADIVLQ